MKSREKMDKKQPSKGTSAKTAGIGMSSIPMTTGTPGVVKQEKMSDEMRYRAEADMGALHRAHQIVTDKPRHAAVKQHAAELFAAAHAPGVSKSTNGRGNTKGFPVASGPSQSVSRKK